MATFAPVSPGYPTDIPVYPNLPQYTWTGNPGGGGGTANPLPFVPVYPLPAGLIVGGSFAMSVAPLLLPFAALLSWWLR